VVIAIEINRYRGGFEDIADFTRRVSTAGYGGRTWFLIWDAAFLRGNLGGTGARYLLPLLRRERRGYAACCAPGVASTVPNFRPNY
jgi:hypothetical protein